MRYYNYDEKKDVGEKIDAILQKYFPTIDFGVTSVGTDREGNLIHITIDRCEGNPIGKTTWTHYANISNYNDKWEVNTQFNGNEKNEMWIYKYFVRFTDAVRYVASGKFKKERPIKIYI